MLATKKADGYTQSPVKFSEVGEAVAWADEIISRCAPEGQFAKLLRTPGVGGVTWEDLRDAAHTVSMKLAAVRPPFKGALLRAIHGDHLSAGLDTICEFVEAEARRRIPEAGLRTGYQIRVLALSLIHRERRKLLGKRYSNARIADDLEISRKTLDGRAWKVLMAGITKIIHEWADDADRQMADMLADAGMMR